MKPKTTEKRALALGYAPGEQRAPELLAKGRGLIAEQIIALAEQHQVHIHQSPELLEVLIQLELGEEIPQALYQAIAEVIAFAYQLKADQQPVGLGRS